MTVTATGRALEARVRLPLERFELDVALATSSLVTGVFGPSGSGKTSLLEAIAGLRRSASGEVRFGGETWLDSAHRRFVPPERRRIGYVPQDGLLFPDRSVRENLLAGAPRARDAGREPERELADVAGLLGLAGLLERSPDTLSGGERQRVALGRALCSGPELLLLDEPFASLDVPLRRRLLPFLDRVRETYRIPTLFVSHDPVEVQALCDELVLLGEGRVLARGAPSELLADPSLFALAQEESFVNVARGRIVEPGDSGARFRLGERPDGPTIAIPATDAAAGDALFVGLAADQILIATHEPTGLSARNVLPATIESARPGPHGKRVGARVAPDVPPLAVEITEASFTELDLRPGREIYLVFKATSCRPYGHEVARRG